VCSRDVKARRAVDLGEVSVDVDAAETRVRGEEVGQEGTVIYHVTWTMYAHV
jgi:hypothetical protein